MAATDPVTEPADRVLVITRVFDAPRELVFKAWTDPQHLVHWICLLYTSPSPRD